MAQASMNDIRARIKSVESTMQITKAMELVATSKLRRAKERAEISQKYRDVLDDALAILKKDPDLDGTGFTEEKAGGRVLYVVIAGDRGLAGGYNNNVFRMTDELVRAESGEVLFLPIGKKAAEHFRHAERFSDDMIEVSRFGVGECQRTAKRLVNAYLDGEVARIELIYTRFVSIMSQEPKRVRLLPLECPEGGRDEKRTPLVDGDIAELLSAIVPEYLGGLLYAAVSESYASECGARRIAMNSASKNAEEMIDHLTLSYNRARQAVITQEITEIVSGAEAL